MQNKLVNKNSTTYKANKNIYFNHKQLLHWIMIETQLVMASRFMTYCCYIEIVKKTSAISPSFILLRARQFLTFFQNPYYLK